MEFRIDDRNQATHAEPDRVGACSEAMLLPWTMPWMALQAGQHGGLLNLAAMQDKTKGWSRLLISCAVVLTGLTLDLNELSRLAVSGLAFALGTIVGVFALGWAGAKLLKTEAKHHLALLGHGDLRRLRDRGGQWRDQRIGSGDVGRDRGGLSDERGRDCSSSRRLGTGCN